MDRKAADRIIVTSNARMSMVLDWYTENKEWLDAQEFHAPMGAGVVELQEEEIEFTFESKGEMVEIAVYPMTKPNLPAVVTFDYDPKKMVATNHRIAPHLPKERRDTLMRIMQADNTDRKEALKYHILMLFITYYRQIVKIEDKGTRTKHEAKKIRKKSDKPLPLIKKQYIIEDFDRKKLQPLHHERRKPDHEVKVRGFLRHYKSGKTVWINPFVKYKGKGKDKKEYEL